MSRTGRREFLIAGLGAAAALRSSAQTKTKRLATDWVTLGKSGVKVTRLAFGTGTMRRARAARTGTGGFTRLVRYAYDNGIRFFETAETYGGMQEMLGIALKGLPRDSYRLMTKYSTPNQGDPLPKIDQYRKQLNTEYIDIMLLHCVRPAHLGHGLSRHAGRVPGSQASQGDPLRTAPVVHGLPALRTVPGNQWLEIAMIRMNHNGTRMDMDSDVEPRGSAIGQRR